MTIFARLPRLRFAPRIFIAFIVTVAAIYSVDRLLLYMVPLPHYLLIERSWLAETVSDVAQELSKKNNTDRSTILKSLPHTDRFSFKIQDVMPQRPKSPLPDSQFAMQKTIAKKSGKPLNDVIFSGQTYDLYYPESAAGIGVILMSDLPMVVTSDMLISADSAVLVNLLVAVRLSNTEWLVVRPNNSGGSMRHYVRYYLGLALTIFIVILFAVWIRRSIVKPLGRLAAAADRLGREREPTPIDRMKLPELDIIANSFNLMQARLKRFVDERMQILAAISHDLRTPLTRLRLLAEYVPDNHQRAQILSDIADMETMVSTSLNFMSDEMHREQVSDLDLAAMLISLVDNFTDAGETVHYHGPDHAYLRCRPVAVRRAFTNLVANGCKYGGKVFVDFRGDTAMFLIDIRDNGPGIPLEHAERAFQPFERLETSRNRETGGTGLGLTIARDAIRGHGGDVELLHLSEGFTVRVTLPRAELS